MDIEIECDGCNDIMGEDDSTALCVSIDELKIGQVIRNLITNAIKFTPAEETAAATLCHATSSDLAEKERLTSRRQMTKNVKERAASVEKSGYSLGGPRGLRGCRYWGRDCASASSSSLMPTCSRQEIIEWNHVLAYYLDAILLQGGGGSGLGL